MDVPYFFQTRRAVAPGWPEAISLWSATAGDDDAATRRLFEVFYTQLWQEHLRTADALWQAKLVLRNEGHPLRDWAGWVLTGDPD